jgi:hypothetical protein
VWWGIADARRRDAHRRHAERTRASLDVDPVLAAGPDGASAGLRLTF